MEHSDRLTEQKCSCSQSSRSEHQIVWLLDDPHFAIRIINLKFSENSFWQNKRSENERLTEWSSL